MTKRKGTGEHLRSKMSDAQLSVMRESLRSKLPNLTDEQFYELTKKLRCRPGDPPPWGGYTTDERAAIFSALPGAEEGYVAELISCIEMTVRIPVLDINEMSKVTNQLARATERELRNLGNPMLALEDRIADVRDIIANGDRPDPIHYAAMTALKALETYRDHLRDEYESLLKEFSATRNRLRPSAQNLFKKTLFDVVEWEWRRSGKSVDFSDDYERFFGSIVDPPFRDPWVQRVNGVAPTDGMFKAHVEAVRKRDKSERPQN
ncbi:hypothetical protein [Xanthobacter tagetidis]|uniref:hypothetical protein n=1 Tax=Xanthobacter tagetidis TaxID=60216 RepID=UPI0011C4792E|nr:hypothetical protein [Xanthobacter tagetidis]MBB6309696.1 hypothetical protein [Xanthobacter tagetidis]